MKFESVMKLREQLDQLGKMQGITQDEKGVCSFHCVILCYSNM